MGYKNLRVGVILNDVSPRILCCLDGTFRFDNLGLCNIFQINDVVLFEDSKSDEIRFAIGLDKFHFYSNLGHHNEDYYDYAIRKKTGICVPKECLAQNDKFIIDNGYGYQFVIFCKHSDVVYVDWRYTDEERDLIISYYTKNETKTPKQIIEETDNYLENLDVNALLESFTISVQDTYISRPGKDDYCYVDKRSIIFDDGYINSLFPTINENIYRDSGFCPAHSMGWDDERRIYRNEELKCIEEAKKKYDKDKHRAYLLCKRLENLLHEKRIRFEKKQKNSIPFVDEVLNLLRDDNVSIEYATELNRMLRTYYRMANKGHEIDWHNFYEKIER